jgi:hypothetical protein
MPSIEEEFPQVSNDVHRPGIENDPDIFRGSFVTKKFPQTNFVSSHEHNHTIFKRPVK